MAHIDAVQPGRVHRVIHEALLDDPEAEVRAMLAYLDQPFEEACLSFHANARAVRPASSEQVRRPINRDCVGHWQPYDKWLDPLKDAWDHGRHLCRERVCRSVRTSLVA